MENNECKQCDIMNDKVIYVQNLVKKFGRLHRQ